MFLSGYSTNSVLDEMHVYSRIQVIVAYIFRFQKHSDHALSPTVIFVPCCRSNPLSYFSATIQRLIAYKMDGWMVALFMATRRHSHRLIKMTVNIFASITPHGSWIYEAECQCVFILVKFPVSELVKILNMFNSCLLSKLIFYISNFK